MRFLHVALALLVVLAGCGGTVLDPGPEPTTDGTETASPESPQTTKDPTSSASPTENDSITVKGGELPVDPNLVFTRILSITGTDVDAPTIHIRSSEDDTDILDSEPSPFRQSLGLVPPENESEGNLTLIAYTPADGETVYLYQWLLEHPTRAENVLAHEFVHVVQFETGWGGTMWDEQPRIAYDETFDGTLTYYLVLEGSATYVQDRYERAHQPTVRPTAMARKEADYRNASALDRLSLARYYYGSQYIDEEVDSPRDLAGIHKNQPNTTEQVLHNTRDPIAPLSVSVDETAEWQVSDRDRMGELFLRIALRTELNRSTAVAGADGWGDDRKVSYTNGDADGYAWVLMWDDEANATEFTDTFNMYLDARATKDNGTWVADEGNSSYRVQRVSDRTIVVFLGNKSFVGNATAATENGEVVVEP